MVPRKRRAVAGLRRSVMRKVSLPQSLRLAWPSTVGRGAVVLLAVAVFASVTPVSAQVRSRQAVAVSRYGFATPVAAGVYRNHLFVANRANSTVTEVDAVTGVLVARLTAASYGFNHPSALVVVGSDVFVANASGRSVTEFSAVTRALVRRISGAAYRFATPMALAAAGGQLFVLSTPGSVTALSTTTGRLVGVAAGSRYGFSRPTSIAVAGGHVFVTNAGNSSVTMVSATTRALVRRLTAPGYGFSRPAGVVAHGTAVWVTNHARSTMTEVAARTGSLVRVISSSNLPMPAAVTYGDGYVFAASPAGPSPMVTQVTVSGGVTWMMCNTNGPYRFSNPVSLAVAGSKLWVVNAGSSSLTEMNAVTGALVRTVR